MSTKPKKEKLFALLASSFGLWRHICKSHKKSLNRLFKTIAIRLMRDGYTDIKNLSQARLERSSARKIITLAVTKKSKYNLRTAMEKWKGFALDKKYS
jgi:hypothetical protein